MNEGTNPGGQFYNGAIQFVSGGSGTFTISLASSAESGIDSVDFLAGPGSGLTGSATTDSSAPFVSGSYSWDGSALTSPQSIVVRLHATGDGTSDETLVVQRDVTAPTGSAPTMSPDTSVVRSNASPTVSFAGDDGSGAGIDATKTKLFRKDGSWASGACSPINSFVQRGSDGLASGFSETLAEGCYQYAVSYVDNVGNATADPPSQVAFLGPVYQLDTAAPTHGLSVLASATNRPQHLSLSFDAGTSTGTLRYNPPDTGEAALTFQLADNVTDTGSGFASVLFQAIAAGGFSGAEKTDTVNPASSATYTVTDANAGAPGAITVTATDNAGRTREATLSFVRDASAPATPTLVSAPSDPSNTASPTFTFSGEAGASFECKLDGAAFGACTSGTTFATGALADGSHTVQIKATDSVGNTDAGSIRSYTWTVDTVAPAAPTITGGPAASSSVSSVDATFTFSVATADGTFECRTDANAFVACTSPRTVTGLSQGSHTFEVRQVDAAGNPSTATSRTWTVDTVAPAAPTITGGPTASASVASTSATFTFTAAEGGGELQCRTDGGAFTTCTSPRDVTGLSQGSHTFEIRQVDAALNAGTAASRTWTVDTVAPSAPTISSGPAAGSLTNSTSASFGFSAAEGGGTIECKLDGGSFAACDSATAHALSGLGEGSHTFQVRQVDAAGNATVTPASRTWTVDTTPPGSAAFATPPGDPISSASATFSFDTTGIGSDTFVCSLDGGGFVTCANPQTYTNLTVGSHTLAVKRRDAAGNVSNSAVSHTWTATPALSSLVVSASGKTVTLSYNAALDPLSVPAPSAFALLVAGVTVTPTVAVSGSTVVLTLDSAIPSGAAVTLAYTVPLTGRIRSSSPLFVDALGFAAVAATNNSTVAPIGVPPATTPAPAPSPSPAKDDAPFLLSSSPADGSTVPSIGPTITFTASEPVAYSSVVFTAPPGAPPAPSFSFNGATASASYSSSVPGLYTFSADLLDGVNAPTPVQAHFTIPFPAGSDAPPVSRTVKPEGGGSMTTSDGSATLSWNPGTFADTVVLTADPVSNVPTGSGFQLGSQVIEVTAALLSDGTPVTTFAQPLDIVFPVSESGVVPAFSRDGGATWTYPQQLTALALPPGVDTGWFREANGRLHVLTLHLTLFALLSDRQAPSAPVLSGALVNARLALRWDPASDNSGRIARYRVFVDGAQTSELDGATTVADLGASSATDTRAIEVAAIDAAGNVGPRSNRVAVVPSVSGLTIAEARRVLAARGFALGDVDGAATGAIDTQSPAAGGVATVGSSVDVHVAVGRASLALKIAGPRTVSLKKRTFVAVRVETTTASKVAMTLRKTVKAKKHYRFRYSVKAGATIIRLKLPKAISPGRYTIFVTATAHRQRAVHQRIQLRLLGPGTLAPVRPAATARKPIDVALVGGRSLALKVKSSFRVQRLAANQQGEVFAAAGGARNAVQAVVLDVSVLGVGFVRDLRTVFPDLRIVAVAATARQAGEARAAGASAVLTTPASARLVSVVLTRLLGPART